MTDTVFAVVEILGRRTRAGAICDQTIGGGTFLCVTHPSMPLTELYSPQAIFSIRVCTEVEAARVAGWAWPSPGAARLELASPFVDLVDVDGDLCDEEDDTYEGDVERAKFDDAHPF